MKSAVLRYIDMDVNFSLTGTSLGLQKVADKTDRVQKQGSKSDKYKPDVVA